MRFIVTIPDDVAATRIPENQNQEYISVNEFCAAISANPRLMRDSQVNAQCLHKVHIPINAPRPNPDPIAQVSNAPPISHGIGQRLYYTPSQWRSPIAIGLGLFVRFDMSGNIGQRG